jgi:hypothetical protein
MIGFPVKYFLSWTNIRVHILPRTEVRGYLFLTPNGAKYNDLRKPGLRSPIIPQQTYLLFLNHFREQFIDLFVIKNISYYLELV